MKFLAWFVGIVFPIMFVWMGDLAIALALTTFLTALAAAMQWVVQRRKQRRVKIPFLVWFTGVTFPPMFIWMGDLVIAAVLTAFLVSIAAGVQWAIRKITHRQSRPASRHAIPQTS